MGLEGLGLCLGKQVLGFKQKFVKPGEKLAGVGPRVLTNPFFSEQCDFTEDQTAGRQSLTHN